MESVVKKARAGILDVVPNYFRDVKDVAGQPGVRIEASSLKCLFDWLGVDHEDPHKAAVIHPCAVEAPSHLHDMEAACRKALGPLVRCAEAYEHHIVSAARLNRCKSILEKNLPRGDILLSADWKEGVKLPLSKVEIGDDHFAGVKKELSVYGAVVKQWVGDKLVEDKYIVVSEEIEHTPDVANKLWRYLLDTIKEWPTTKCAHFWSDCGNHFRSYENLLFSAYDLVTERQIRTKTCQFCEKHGKGKIDGEFGEVDRAFSDFLDTEGAIIDTKACVLEVLRSHFRRKANYHVVDWSPGATVPDTQRWLKPARDYLITRSYCVEAMPNPVRAHGGGAQELRIPR